MNPDTAHPPTSSKRQLMLSLTAIAMGLAVAAFLLTRPRIAAPASKAGCSGCGASAAASNACEMRAAPYDTTDANTNAKTSGVSHE